LMHS